MQVNLDKWHISDIATDYIYLGENKINFIPPGNLGIVYSYKLWKEIKQGYPFFSYKEYQHKSIFLNFLPHGYFGMNIATKANVRTTHGIHRR